MRAMAQPAVQEVSGVTSTLRELDSTELSAVAGSGGFYDENPGPGPADKASFWCAANLYKDCQTMFRMMLRQWG